MTRLSVTIIAWNEEDRLRACLESVAWADEIIVRYAALAAQDIVRRGGRVGLLDLALRPQGRFLSMYLLRAGFLDGWRGFVLAVLYANYVFLRTAKAWEARRGQHGKDPSTP